MTVESEESDFIEYRPEITQPTVIEAAQAWGSVGEIRSLNGQGTALDSFILLLATDAEVHGPYLLNSVCARELCRLLLSEGFGPPST
jgi:hypothetical protein